MSKNRLHHAIMLMGSEGIGKHALASSLSKQLLCKQLDEHFKACGQCQACNLFEAASHPDFYWLTTDKTQIGVDLIRQAIESLNSKSQLSHNKVLVVPNAHLMSESAANALLKTLEEPTQQTYIILVTHQPNRLLPTILSRCEKQVLPTPRMEQSIEWMINQTQQKPDLNPNNLAINQDLLVAYGMAPLTALNSLTDDETLKYVDFSNQLAELLKGQSDIFKIASDWHASSERVIQWLQRYLKEKQMTTTQLDSGAVWSAIEKTNHAALKVRHPGTNKAMLLFQLLTTISSLEA